MSNPLATLQERHPDLAHCGPDIEMAFSALRSGYATDGKLLLGGNGPSGALAEYWATLMLKANQRPRRLDSFWAERFGAELAQQLEGALPTLSLSSFTGLNAQFDPQYALAQLVWALGKAADVLVVISPTGTCPNLLAALETAQALDIIPLALTSGDGAALGALADINISVPDHGPETVQQYHKAVVECLAQMLETEYFA